MFFSFFFFFLVLTVLPFFFTRRGTTVRARSRIISRKKTEDNRDKEDKETERIKNTHPKRLEENKASRRRDAVVFLEEDNTLCVPFLIKSV